MTASTLARIGLPAVAPTDAIRELRAQVREFLRTERERGGFTPTVNSWMSGWDRDFSRRLANAGFLGMTIPTQYGGRGRTFLDRFVVNAELLAAGAPVAAHWFADRQVAPALLSSGTEAQKRRFLPAIAAGEATFAIGMSEPDSGSDLASIRTQARRDGDGTWRLSGTKVWTSGAHRADHILLLARTQAKDPAARHAGMSQFIVDLSTPGIDIRPIVSMDGEHHFNEVIFDQVAVGDDALLGVEGNGWAQVTSELGFERSGPERFLSTQVLLESIREHIGHLSPGWASELGRYGARLAALHQMSMSVADAQSRGRDAATVAGLVKMLGTATEGELTENVGIEVTPAAPPVLASFVRQAMTTRAGFTLRGGTNEILRGVLAREIGLR
ncbi:acyl-CoA dehydrogenase family protein [Mycobacterium sp. NAZ190054]|uniref:acyl-CoA dehydrogenase family protein n=1 Tax=Mycobacterium sp. NAZ190054 TaxID=1747766 RepID=UPI00079C336F|nr:acyl-CoA dehydrogenase family protein [Mycobacterium sp. NAZ190054]KWX68750.1 acyl-CoA dehydrogenase [Mycobacterium sp. NAZ190054]